MGLTNPKWLIGIISLFLMLSILSGILEGAYLGDSELADVRRFTQAPFTEPWAMPGWIVGILSKVLFFDYAFFHGEWAILRYIFFLPIGIGVIISYGALLFQAAVVALRGAVGGIARLLGV